MGWPDEPFLNLRQTATPKGTPQNGGNLLYVKSDGKLYTKNSAGVETVVDTAETLPLALFDAKGDLLVGTANDAASRLAVGANATSLVADSTQATGIKWENRVKTVTATGAGIGVNNADPLNPVVSLTTMPFFKGVPVTASQAITAGVNIPFTATEDTNSGWNSGSNYYTIPTSGLYRVTGQVKIDSTNTVGSIAITNSTGTVLAWAPNQPAAGGFAGSQITDVLRFTSGQTVALRPQVTDALQNDSVENSFFIIEYVRP